MSFTRIAAVAATVGVLLSVVSARAAQATPIPTPDQDPFYRYSGSTPLEQLPPGAVLDTRRIDMHIATIPTPVHGVQMLYRTSDQAGTPITTVTTVLRPIVPSPTPKLLSYQSFYDSLTPKCEPSYVLAGGADHGLIATAEEPIMAGYLLQGYTIVTSDFEGQVPSFATGPQYGPATLDGIRAAFGSPEVGLPSSTKVGMIGYSGGAIATEWATELAPEYAPDVDKRLVGSAIGGVMVHPDHNLHYVDGSLAWTGALPMALIGIARSYHVDLTPYLNDYGKKVYNDMQDACFFTDALGHLPGVTFASMVKPEYSEPESIPVFVELANKLIMGTGGTPTAPLFVRQATNGILEGTPGTKPGIGAGDGVMIAGDVRTLARDYCDRGLPVDYREYPLLSHIPAGAVFMADAAPWLARRFAGRTPSSSCGHIAPGNPLTPIG